MDMNNNFNNLQSIEKKRQRLESIEFKRHAVEMVLKLYDILQEIKKEEQYQDQDKEKTINQSKKV